ncbi:Eukaryotic translation initiation factor 4b1, partial [Thalictrum thalictroides]
TGITRGGSSESAECGGIMTAIQWSYEHGYLSVELETDCAGAADYLNKKLHSLSWTSSTILNSVLYMAYLRKHQQQQTMSKPWGGAGAWAADAERADAEETERLAANPVVESPSFPSLKESLGAKPKKKNKGITLSLSEFSSGAYTAPKRDQSLELSKGLTHDEMIRLPTGPRERSAEEMEVGRLGGGFKNYGGGRSQGSSMGGRRSGDDGGGDGSWGGRKSNGGFDNDRRSERAPSRDSDLPSRADEVDNWAVGKKSPLSRIDSGRERDNRYGSGDNNGRQDKYSSLGGGSRADEVDNWGTGKKSLPVRSSTSSFGSGFRDPLAAQADRWTRTGPPREGDRERPRLNLDPPRGNGTLNEAGDRERPRLVLNPPSGNGSLNEAPKSTRPSPFGAARPREDVLAEKGVDVKKLDSDIETKKSSRPTSPHSSRPSSAHSNGRAESPAPLVLEGEPNPRPKVNPFGDAKPREVLLQEKGQDWRKNDVELEHRSVEAKVWRKNDFELEQRSVEV